VLRVTAVIPGAADTELAQTLEEAVMMLAYRLVRLIETHSDALATSLLQKVQNSEVVPLYSNVPAEELKQRVYEIYRHLGDWLLGKSEFDIEKRYAEIGARRAQQSVPLSQLTWTIILTKENLWEFCVRNLFWSAPWRSLASWKCCSCWINFLIGLFTLRRWDMSALWLRRRLRR